MQEKNGVSTQRCNMVDSCDMNTGLLDSRGQERGRRKTVWGMVKGMYSECGCECELSVWGREAQM